MADRQSGASCKELDEMRPMPVGISVSEYQQIRKRFERRREFVLNPGHTVVYEEIVGTCTEFCRPKQKAAYKPFLRNKERRVKR
jgi:hypothetical protein